MPGRNISYEELNGIQKASIMLMAMGEEFTSSIFKKLDEETIKEIGKQMSRIESIPSDLINLVMDEFLESIENNKNIQVSWKSFLKSAVDMSLDERKAREVYKAIEDESGQNLFGELAYLPAQNIASMLKGEHPQTIALVLSLIPSSKAAEVLCLFPEDIKASIGQRILMIGEVQGEVLKDLEELLKRDSANFEQSSSRINGLDTLANILNEVDSKTENNVLSFIEKEDTELAEMIRRKMFVFEDLVAIDDKSFREILQNISNDILVKALKTASDEMKEKIFSNLSERAAEMLRDDFEVLGPVRLAEVEENQQEIIKVAKKLEAAGKIMLAGKSKEDVFI